MEADRSSNRKSTGDVGNMRGRPRDPSLPRTWERDLVYGRDILGHGEPRGVLWVSELRGGDRDRGVYRLVIVSDFRVFVTNGKQGLVSSFIENVMHGVHSDDEHIRSICRSQAHFYDLERICYIAGDRVEFHFKRFALIIDDTVGTCVRNVYALADDRTQVRRVDSLELATRAQL